MFEKLPFWGQVVMMAVISLIVISLAYWFFPDLSQMKVDIARLEADLEEKNRKIREGRLIEENLPQLEQEIANLERKLEDISVVLPTGPETGDLLRWIKNLGDQSNLDLKSFSPQAMTPKEFYKEFPIVMQINGTYHDLGLFLDRVSKYTRIINVDNIAMTGQSGNVEKTISASFTATTFVYDEKAAGQEVGQ